MCFLFQICVFVIIYIVFKVTLWKYDLYIYILSIYYIQSSELDKYKYLFNTIAFKL